MPAGRPSKIVPFLDAAEKIFSDLNFMLFTDAELIFKVNETLAKKDRVDVATWERWKSGEVKAANGDDEIGDRFRGLLKKAVLKQKEHLYKQFQTDDKVWTRWAWIIERKFKEWNLKQISENTTDLKVEGIDMSKWK